MCVPLECVSNLFVVVIHECFFYAFLFSYVCQSMINILILLVVVTAVPVAVSIAQ